MIPQHSLPTLFVLGDSISIHYGPYLQKASKGFLQYDRKQGASGVEENNMDVATGANGGDSSMVLAYLKPPSDHNFFSSIVDSTISNSHSTLANLRSPSQTMRRIYALFYARQIACLPP